MVFVRLLVAREAHVAIDPLHTEVRSRIHLQMGAQRSELRAKLDDELSRRLEQLLLVVRSVFVEPVFAVVPPQCAEKSSRALRKSRRHRAQIYRYRIPSTFRAMVRSDATLFGARSRRACFSSARIARSACRSSSSAARTSCVDESRSIGPSRPRPKDSTSAWARLRARSSRCSSWSNGRR